MLLVPPAYAGSAHADAVLIASCRDLGAKWIALAEGSQGSTHPRHRLGAAERSLSRLLRSIAGMRASTPEGHQARAAAFVIWDDGDLLGRVAADRILGEVLLAAIVVDLLTAPGARGNRGEVDYAYDPDA